MGNKSTTNQKPISLEELTQELLTNVQSRSRTKSDTSLLRATKITEKMSEIDSLSTKVKRDIDTLSSATPSVPKSNEFNFDDTITQLLTLLDSVETCRLQIPEQYRPKPFSLPPVR